MSWDVSNNSSCDGKKVFNSFGAAESFERRMRRAGSPIVAKGKKIEKLHAYKCRKCNKFHLGHAPRKHR